MDDEIKKAIQSARLAQSERIYGNNIEKGGKPAGIGEIRQWGGKRVQKQADGRWMEVPDAGKKPTRKTYTDEEVNVSYYDEFDEDFLDEDTGEVVTVKRKVFNEAGKRELDRLTSVISEKYDGILNEKLQENKRVSKLYEQANDKRYWVEMELKELKTDLRALKIDMEEGVPIAINQGRDPDEIANEYGEKINDLEDEIRKKEIELRALAKEEEKWGDAQYTTSSEVDEIVQKIKDGKRKIEAEFHKRYKG